MNPIINKMLVAGLVIASGYASAETPVKVSTIDTPQVQTVNDNAVVADIKSYQPTRIDPLSLYVRTVYPDDVKTVADAVSFVLGASGYRLVVSYPAPDDAIAILGKPIPPIAKIARTMPIIDAIQILIGTNNWIVVDQNHKLISVSKEPT